jgi:hypothetical protein
MGVMLEQPGGVVDEIEHFFVTKTGTFCSAKIYVKCDRRDTDEAHPRQAAKEILHQNLC